MLRGPLVVYILNQGFGRRSSGWLDILVIKGTAS